MDPYGVDDEDEGDSDVEGPDPDACDGPGTGGIDVRNEVTEAGRVDVEDEGPLPSPKAPESSLSDELNMSNFWWK